MNWLKMPCFLHDAVNEHLEKNKQEFNWISQLGVEELSDITFIQNVICKSDYITEDNSIEVTRFCLKAILSIIYLMKSKIIIYQD